MLVPLFLPISLVRSLGSNPMLRFKERFWPVQHTEYIHSSNTSDRWPRPARSSSRPLRCVDDIIVMVPAVPSFGDGGGWINTLCRWSTSWDGCPPKWDAPSRRPKAYVRLEGTIRPCLEPLMELLYGTVFLKQLIEWARKGLDSESQAQAQAQGHVPDGQRPAESIIT